MAGYRHITRSETITNYIVHLFNHELTDLRMMSEMTEEDFERMLDQFCADAAPPAGEEIREVELVVADGPPADGPPEDDDVIMVPQSPTRARTPEPLTSPPDLPPTISPPAHSGVDKVNENHTDMLSILDSSIEDDVETGSVSGYQASKSSSNKTNLFNYTKYGTRSKLGEDEVYIECEKPSMSSTYYQCKAARAALRNYATVDVSIGPEAGVSEVAKFSSVGSLDCHGDTEILKTFRGSRITAGGTTVNQNISATFDPSNLKCVVCSNAHYILSKGPEDSPPTIILSDQNFVSTLSGGNSCFAIVRIEDASLPELTDLAFEILERHTPPAGTLFLFGSASHLLNAGTTIYTQEWCHTVNRISTRYPDARILPLVPVIREDCPGVVSRQLIELATWYKTVYQNNVLGIASVWDSLIVTLCKTDEDGLDLGYNEHYSVAMPSFLAPNAPLRNFKFKSNSSHTTTRGMDCVASKELLSSLISKLKCTFATYANTEEIFSAEPAELESMLVSKTVHIFGGSNMRKIIPELEKNGFVVVDNTIPGWVPNPANIAKLSEKIESAKPDDIVVADLLTNTAYRYEQVDGTLALPYKSDGKYHFDGEIRICTTANLKSIFCSLKPALLKCKCHLVLTPPMPRHIHDRCCLSLDHCTNVGTEKHAEKMLGHVNTLRTACISNLEQIGAKKFSVPDVVKLAMPACIGIPEYAAALKSLMKPDGVHFTDSGYSCIANGLATHIHTVQNEKPQTCPAAVPNVSGPRRAGKQSYYWRGFVSPVGVGRPTNHKAAYLQSHTNPTATRGGGGEGGGKMRSAHISHGYAPYRGGKNGKK
jgi:hypothetical protein